MAIEGLVRIGFVVDVRFFTIGTCFLAATIFKKLLADKFRVCDFDALDQAARHTLTLVLAMFGGWSLSRDRNSRNRQYFRGAKSLVCALASLSGWRALADPGATRDL